MQLRALSPSMRLVHLGRSTCHATSGRGDQLSRMHGLGEGICCPLSLSRFTDLVGRVRCRSNVDGFVLRIQHVNLGIVSQAERGRARLPPTPNYEVFNACCAGALLRQGKGETLFLLVLCVHTVGYGGFVCPIISGVRDQPCTT